MKGDILRELKTWREERARKEGVELYRVLPNAAVDEIARTLPGTREDLLSVKGIKEAKYRKYGVEILGLIARYRAGADMTIGDSLTGESRITDHGSRGKNDFDSDNLQSAILNNPQSDALSVSRFLDGLNLELSGMAARVRGEVSSVDERERVVYFSLKDAGDGSTLPCLIFRTAYVMSGVRLAVGDEVIVEGVPEVWKPMGKLSMKCGFIEYAGEGALKKAYEALLAKLTDEGLFAPERKREVPAFPTRVALLTSRDGAAIGDFMTNVGRHGYRIDLFASSVEGARAVPELLGGLRYFRKRADRYDVLVVVRGGGSLESLQAFNNEALVREIATFTIPVIAGIGHEKDITLASLVADAMVSTPTAAARLVRQSWEEGTERVASSEHILRSRVSDSVSDVRIRTDVANASLVGYFRGMEQRIRTIISRFLAKREMIAYGVRSWRGSVSALSSDMVKGKSSLVSGFRDTVENFEKLLAQFDPNRALRLGYGLVRLSSGKLLRKSTDASVGDRLDIRLAEGGIEAEVKNILE